MKSKMVMWIGIAFLLSGCMAHVSKVGSFDASTPQLSKGTRILAYSNFTDARKDQTKVGMISALLLKTQRPVGDIMADSIAYDLNAKHDLAIKKVYLQDPLDSTSISKAAKANGADYYLAGVVREFDIASVDAIMHPANCVTKYEIHLFDKEGKLLLKKELASQDTHYIGLGGQAGSDQAIQKNVDAATKKLVSDGEFITALN